MAVSHTRKLRFSDLHWTIECAYRRGGGHTLAARRCHAACRAEHALPRPRRWPPHRLGREATTLPGRGHKTFLISSFNKALAEVCSTQTSF